MFFEFYMKILIYSSINIKNQFFIKIKIPIISSVLNDLVAIMFDCNFNNDLSNF